MSELVKIYQSDILGDFHDSVYVWQKFLEIVNSLPGVIVISSIKHDFPGGGFSGLILIGESHAAIHTWPEVNKAWVELATCGDQRALGVFEYKVHYMFRFKDSPLDETPPHG